MILLFVCGRHDITLTTVAHHSCMGTKATEVNVLCLVFLAGHPSSEIHTKLAVSTDDTSRPNFIPPRCNCVCEQ